MQSPSQAPLLAPESNSGTRCVKKAHLLGVQELQKYFEVLQKMHRRNFELLQKRCRQQRRPYKTERQRSLAEREQSHELETTPTLLARDGSAALSLEHFVQPEQTYMHR